MSSGPKPIPYGHVPGFLPGSASLVLSLSRNVLLILRDNRCVYGKLVTLDQFGNVCIDNAKEVVFGKLVKKGGNGEGGGKDGPPGQQLYVIEKTIGTTIIKGEEIIIMGETDDKNMVEYKGRKDEFAEVQHTDWGAGLDGM